MANFKMVFYGSEISNTEEHELTAYHNSNNEIFIQIKTDDNYPQFICLDKSTAIRFAKTIRTEINKITESEASNG